MGIKLHVDSSLEPIQPCDKPLHSTWHLPRFGFEPSPMIPYVMHDISDSVAYFIVSLWFDGCPLQLGGCSGLTILNVIIYVNYIKKYWALKTQAPQPLAPSYKPLDKTNSHLMLHILFHVILKSWALHP